MEKLERLARIRDELFAYARCRPDDTFEPGKLDRAVAATAACALDAAIRDPSIACQLAPEIRGLWKAVMLMRSEYPELCSLLRKAYYSLELS